MRSTARVTLTDEGWEKVEQLARHRAISSIPENWDLKHHVAAALKAHALYQARRGVRGEGRRGHHRGRVHRPPDAGPPLVDGLHQAVEAKESVKIERENQTLATITFQNYFRMYKKLAGMTGTAETEAAGVRQDLQARSRGDSDQPADAAA